MAEKALILHLQEIFQMAEKNKAKRNNDQLIEKISKIVLFDIQQK